MCPVTFPSAPSYSMPYFTVDDLQILNRETSWVVGCSRRSSRLDLQPQTVISAIQRTHSPPNAGITTLCILYLDFKSVFVEPDQHPFFTAITEHPFFFLYFVSLQQPNLQHSNERGAGGCLLFTRWSFLNVEAFWWSHIITTRWSFYLTFWDGCYTKSQDTITRDLMSDG